LGYYHALCTCAGCFMSLCHDGLYRDYCFQNWTRNPDSRHHAPPKHRDDSRLLLIRGHALQKRCSFLESETHWLGRDILDDRIRSQICISICLSYLPWWNNKEYLIVKCFIEDAYTLCHRIFQPLSDLRHYSIFSRYWFAIHQNLHIWLNSNISLGPNKKGGNWKCI